MSAATPLDRLAAACHIEPGYRDIWQRQHETGVETKRALLGAMGVAADSDGAIEDSLDVIAAETVSRLLPPVLVRRVGDQLVLPVTIQAGRAQRLAWTFVREDGAERTGEARFADLDVIERLTVRGETWLRYALPLPMQAPLGYHRCAVVLDEERRTETEIIITPARAFLPEHLKQGRCVTGLMAPLYGLRSERNAGIGDFSDLVTLATMTASLGGDFIGINPTHALFPGQPHRISPYAPSSRLFLNALMIALDKIPELDTSPIARSMLESVDVDRLRATDLVAYDEVSALKLGVLENLFETFAALPEDAPRKAAFHTFCSTSGTALADHARFEALAEHLARENPSMTDWRDWPEGYRTPGTPDVLAFAEAHADRVTFYGYLQWLAAEQLDAAQSRALDAGMALGLYRDLAVGVAPDGAEAWCHQDVLVEKARIGAPPDDFNPEGQNWGLLPFSPRALQADAYRPFIGLIRHNMRSAGALRIDHVLGLARSFWWPEGADIAGAYVRYPLNDLLGLVALESERNRCVVIGEDLGTVPEILRSELDERDLLGCRLLYFERDEAGTFRSAAAYPRNCIASIGTHDLPTLQGFWNGQDIETREKLGLYPDEAGRRADLEDRARQRSLLLQRLQAENLLPDGIDPEHPPEALTQRLVDAFHRFLGATPAMLKAVQLEDAVSALEQANLPGTIDEHPNWRRKVGPPLERLVRDDRLAALLQAIA